jgi:large conductance mechanosensitive channel
MLKEFKEFAVKGNVVDMAVGIVIGAAFTTVVKSIVDDLIMPPIALITGGLDFSNKFVILREGAGGGEYLTLDQARQAGATVLSYGRLINAMVAFLIVALVLFFVVRWINRLRRPDTPPAPSTRSCPFCKSVIDRAATRCAHCTSELPEPA